MRLLTIIGFCALNVCLCAQTHGNKLEHTAPQGGVSSYKTSAGSIELPRIYTDNMVLQRNSVVTIPGIAAPRSKVVLKADWLSAPVSAVTDGNGKFTLKLPTPDCGGPYTIVLNDGHGEKVLHNILIGEVWLCSGQSNMEFPVRGDWARVADADRVVADMRRPALRLLQIKNTTSLTPLDDASVEYGWVESTPAAESFSAIGYLYGRMLQDSLNVPVGVIDATWGGTTVEAWTPREALKGVPGFEYYYELSGGKDRETALSETEVRRTYEASGGKKPAYPFDKSRIQTGKTWGKMPVPSLWEDNALPGFDGIVAMQFELNLPKDAAGKDLLLCLGAVDDMDRTYFNGIPVGSCHIHDLAREYKVDGSLVKAGENVITVEVVDNGGGGGIWRSSYAVVDGKRYTLDGNWNYTVLSDFSKTGMSYVWPESNNRPMVLYNAMINPLTTLPIAGVIWYQGCQNVGRDAQYEVCFKNMIQGWRKAFDNPDMPFYFVQLAGFLQPVAVQPDSKWALLRYAQSKALDLPNTAMATAIDIGNPVDIHPVNKAEVARRLAIIALVRLYGMKQICEAPACTSVVNDGKSVTLTFSGPVKAVGGVATGFIIGDRKGKWVSAGARMIDDRTIRISSPLIADPVAVRYDWADYPGGNLYGANNLPLLPFATDK